MATYDARPSAFTQLTLTSEWEYMVSAILADSFDGIDPDQGSAMAPSLDSPGRNAVMADGNVLIKGQLWRCDAPVGTSIPAASAQNRIDRLVLRLTRGATTSATVVQPVVITGTPSGSPTIPPITQTTTGIFDIPVSRWTSTSAGAITGMSDERQYCTRFLSAWKAADTSRASNTTRTNDPDLVLASLAQNATYRISAYISYTTLAASGIGVALGFNTPTGAAGRWNAIYRISGDTAQPSGAAPAGVPDFGWSNYFGSGGLYAAAATPGDSQNHGIWITGTLITGATIGGIGISWAQDASNVTAVTFKAGSYLIAERLI